MSRFAAKLDANQPAIITALIGQGCVVESLAACGNGVYDLLCGLHGRLFLVEVKDGNKKPSARALTPAQQMFRAKFSGFPLFVAESPAEAIAIAQSIERRNRMENT